MNRIGTFEGLNGDDIIKIYNVENVESYKFIKELYASWEVKLKEYIYSEHVLSVVYKIKDGKPFNFSDIEAVLSGIGESFIPHDDIYFFDSIDEKERLIIKTYWYFKLYSSSVVSNINLIKIYLDDSNKNCIRSARLFKLENDKIVPNIDNITDNDVYKKYIEISSLPMSLESFDVSKNYDKNGIVDKYLYDAIEDSSIKERCGIKKYEELNEILNSVDVFKVAEEMDNLIVKNTSKKSSHYRETIEKINMLKYDGTSIVAMNKHLLELNGIYTHLAGKTGAGKSVELDMVLKILSNSNKRILVVTPNHASSFKVKRQCESLEVPNVMLMGRNREEYMNIFFESMFIEETQKNKLNSGREINHVKALSYYKKAEKLFADISGGCSDLTVKKCFERDKGVEYTEDKFYYKPCDGCSDVKECAFAKPYRDAFSNNVNVIIAPIQTLTKSKLLGGLDVERRTLWESLLLTVDLVVIDEIDEIQSLIESVYAYKDIIYSNDSQVNSSKIEGSVEYYKNELGKISRKSIAESYPVLNRKLNDFDNLINFIGKYFLSDKTIELVEKEIKFSTSFDEDSLVYDYFKRYYYKSKRDEEVLKDKVNKFLKILKSEDSKQYLDELIGVLIDKYTKNEENYLEYMITDTEDKTMASRFSDVYDAYFKIFEDEMVRYNIPQINNKGKKNKANNKGMIKHLMFIFLIVKLKKDYNSLVIEAELKINISRKKNSITSTLPSLTKSLLDSVICGFVIDRDDVVVDKGNGQIETQKSGRLKIFKYEGIGREVLLNTNKYLSVLYGTQVVPMLMCSATSGDTKSSLHTIKYPVNLVLQNTDQLKDSDKLKDYLKVFCHVFEYDGKICTTSGDYNNRIKNAQNMCKAMKSFLRNLVEERRHHREGVLLVSPSAEISYEIHSTLTQMFPDMNIKVLYTSSHEKEFDVSIHIDRNAVEQCASKEVDILIAVNQTIARGFNILKNVDGETNKSYFTDIIMFNRFLPSPEDYLTHISFAHIMLEKTLKDKTFTIDDFGDKYLSVVKEANRNLRKMKYIEGFSQLPVKLKEMIIGNIYCLLSQIKGRGQRGGSNCRIHLIDANCYPETAKLMQNKRLSELTLASSKFRPLAASEDGFDDKESMMQGLIDILNQGDELSNLLFDEMKEAFNNHLFVNHFR